MHANAAWRALRFAVDPSYRRNWLGSYEGGLNILKGVEEGRRTDTDGTCGELHAAHEAVDL